MARYDLVIFGATGFTGQRAVEALVRGGSGNYAGLTWAVAGRTEKKLRDLLIEIARKTGMDLSSVPVVTADVSDYQSLKNMCAQARVLLNFCGPYRDIGEPVVRAAVESGAHYLDISGEPAFIENMQLEYDRKARDAGVYLIGACGFDSVPADMGQLFLEQNFGGALNSVESYLSFSLPQEYEKLAKKKGAIGSGTWESFIYGVVDLNAVNDIRKKLYKEPMPTFKPVVKHKMTPHKVNGRWAIPFLGADGDVVTRSQIFGFESANKRPVQYRPYVTFDSLWTVMKLGLIATVVFLFAKMRCTRNWLVKHPRFFSGGLATREGPPQEVIQNTKFTFDLVGQGWEKGQNVDIAPPKKIVRVRVSHFDPAYGFATLAILQAAVSILLEQDKMPPPGVLTTASAFANTSLITRLQENNVEFMIVDKETNATELKY